MCIEFPVRLSDELYASSRSECQDLDLALEIERQSIGPKQAEKFTIEYWSYNIYVSKCCDLLLHTISNTLFTFQIDFFYNI